MGVFGIDSKDVRDILIGVVVLSVCCWISTKGEAPITLQSFGVFMVLRLMGGRNGTYAVIFHSMLGFVGFPVFTHFMKGPESFLTPAGCYYVGFIAASLVYCLIMGFRFSSKHSELQEFTQIMNILFYWVKLILAMVLAMAACYWISSLWYLHVVMRGSGALTLGAAFKTVALPQVIPDIIKVVLAYVISRAIIFWGGVLKYGFTDIK